MKRHGNVNRAYWCFNAPAVARLDPCLNNCASCHAFGAASSSSVGAAGAGANSRRSPYSETAQQ